MKDDLVNPIIRHFVRNQTDIKVDRYSKKGGFGELYFGSRIILKDRVALKFYSLEDTDGHEEPQLLKEIEHENILRIFDAKLISKDIAYFLTPEISGGDLQNYLDSNKIKVSEALQFTKSILNGLIELHKDPRNFVHRDLKPGNILIDQENSHIYLADFGTLKQLPSNTMSVSASKFTFFYRPPEVVLKNEFSKQSDIYQVGIILYQCLNGFFPLNNYMEWLDNRARAKFSALATYDQPLFLNNYFDGIIIKGGLLNYDKMPPYISKKIKSIIKRATHIDLSKRYQTCADFIKAIFDYESSFIDWWDEGEILYAFNNKKKIYYRIVKSGNERIVEESKDCKMWRKKNSNSKTQVLIDYIESMNNH